MKLFCSCFLATSYQRSWLASDAIAALVVSLLLGLSAKGDNALEAIYLALSVLALSLFLISWYQHK